MDANKINNKIEINNETFHKVINTDQNMNFLCQNLPIFYQYPINCYINNVEIEFKKSSKPCILCNNYCSMCITPEDIVKPKLTRQTNQNIIWFDNQIKNTLTMFDYLKSKKDTFMKKDNK